MKNKQIRVPSPHSRQQFMEWYGSSSQGQTLRDSESSYLLNSLNHTYYQRILQVGRLGTETNFIPEGFLRNFCLLVEEGDSLGPVSNTVFASKDEWPIASESVDTLILPHLIEFEADPHAILSEADRVLKPEGRMIVLGFNPWSPTSLLQFGEKSPKSWNGHFVRSSQVVDWLNLLKFEAEFNAGFALPSSRAFIEPRSAWQRSIAILSPVYAVKAIKRTWTLIPMQQSWVAAPDLLAGQAMSPPLMGKPQ